MAVFGCGGVGNAAIAGARALGATTIIAVDVEDRKLHGAKAFGATYTVNSTQQDPVEAVRALTRGHGADVVIEAVGLPQTYEQAFYARDLAGMLVLVGVPTPDKQLTLPMIDVFSRGGALKSSWYGDCLPTRDFPMLVELYRQGRFPLDAFVTERTVWATSSRPSPRCSAGTCCAPWSSSRAPAAASPLGRLRGWLCTCSTLRRGSCASSARWCPGRSVSISAG